jgi:tetratricopeptide (TPR) repeat protein
MIPETEEEHKWGIAKTFENKAFYISEMQFHFANDKGINYEDYEEIIDIKVKLFEKAYRYFCLLFNSNFEKQATYHANVISNILKSTSPDNSKFLNYNIVRDNYHLACFIEGENFFKELRFIPRTRTHGVTFLEKLDAFGRPYNDKVMQNYLHNEKQKIYTNDNYDRAKESIKWFTRALEFDDSYIDALLSRAKALRWKAEYLFHFKSGEALILYKKNREEVLKELEKVLELNPKSEKALLEIGLTYLYPEITENEKAIEYLSIAIKIGTSDYKIYYYRGQAYHNLNMKDEANEDYVKATKLDTITKNGVLAKYSGLEESNLKSAIRFNNYTTDQSHRPNYGPPDYCPTCQQRPCMCAKLGQIDHHTPVQTDHLAPVEIDHPKSVQTDHLKSVQIDHLMVRL